MPKLNLRTAKRIKVASGEVLRLKGQGFEWEPPFVPISATGGTITDVEIGGRMYRVHDILSSTDFVVTSLGSEAGAARALAVGAGASGAHRAGHGPGPGAGGDVIEQDVTLTLGTFAIVVGAGGPAVGPNTNGISGSNTTGLGLDADGGGYGGTEDNAGGNAANGGGGGADAAVLGSGKPGGVGTRNGGSGWGTAFAGRASRAGGGSAGAGTAGGNAASLTGGTGGDGKESSIDGVSRYYGAGVSGYAYVAAGGTIPPAPLGGVQGTTFNAPPNSGTDGLGNGGSAYGGSLGSVSGRGGNGRFIVRYPLEAAA